LRNNKVVFPPQAKETSVSSSDSATKQLVGIVGAMHPHQWHSTSIPNALDPAQAHITAGPQDKNSFATATELTTPNTNIVLEKRSK